MKRVLCAVAALCVLLGVSTAGAETRQWIRMVQDPSANLAVTSTADGSQVYVVTYNKLYRFSSTGALVWATPVPTLEGRDLQVAPGGYVYVAGQNGLAKFAPSGAMVWWKKIGKLNGVAVNPTGSTVVAAGNASTSLLVRKVNPQGAVVWTSTWRPAGSTLASAGPVALDPAGNIYVSGGANCAAWQAFTAKVLPTGQFAWKQPSSGYAHDLAYSSGVLYGAGCVASGQFDLLKTLFRQSATTGATAWSTHTRYPLGGSSCYNGVAVKPKTGEIYVTGSESTSSNVWVTEKYLTSGWRLWRVASQGTGDDIATFGTGFYVVGKNFVNGAYRMYLSRYAY